MVIAQNPGATEVAFGRPLVGPSGRLFESLLVAVGLDRATLFLTNVYKYGTEDNREPTPEELNDGIDELRSEIQSVGARYILALGNVATRHLTGRGEITKLRGELLSLRSSYGSNAQVLPTVHPAACLRNPKYIQFLREDLKVFKRLLEDSYADLPVVWQTGVHALAGQTGQYHCVVDVENVKGGELKSVGIYTGRDPVAEFAGSELGEAFLWLADHASAISAWNLKHELKYFRQYLPNWETMEFHDPMLMHYLLDENEKHDLETSAQIWLGVKPWKENKRDRIFAGDETFPEEDMLAYNAMDVRYEAEIEPMLRTELQQDHQKWQLYQHLLIPATQMFAGVEEKGIYVDEDRLREVGTLIGKERAAIRRRLHSTYGDINLNSPQQLSRLLYRDLGLPLTEFTPSGAPSTNELALKRNLGVHPIIPDLLAYRKAEKEMSYLESYSDLSGEQCRIRPSYYLLLVTGRTAASGPNIQQVPRSPRIRSIFRAAPGTRFVIADLSQVELRVTAWVADERNMVSAFNRGADLHLRMATILTGKPEAEITKEERSRAKIPNFMFVYGGEEYTYIINCLREFDMVVSMEEARRDREAFFTAWPDLEGWYSRVAEEIRGTGMVRSHFGRTRHLPDFASTSQSVREAALREGINFGIQSAASDIALTAAVLIDRQYPGTIVGYVHDSVMLEVEERDVERVASDVKFVMEHAAIEYALDRGYLLERPTVPIVADVKITDRWE